MLWVRGEPWRELSDELRATLVTVVTANGSSRVLALAEGWQQRVPLIDGHHMARDLRRQPLNEIVFASPCGVHTETGLGQGWHLTTPVLAVIAGEDLEWAATPECAALVEAAFADDRGDGRGDDTHPQHPCPVPYCTLRQQMTVIGLV